ncbi:MAG: hypothetical protein ACLUTO_01360 [Anaerostipes sp.]
MKRFYEFDGFYQISKMRMTETSAPDELPQSSSGKTIMTDRAEVCPK